MSKDLYRVEASTQRHPYPVYRFYREPSEWHCNGTIKVSCKDGKVDVNIMEKDSTNIHTLSVWSDDGHITARLTEEVSQAEHL